MENQAVTLEQVVKHLQDNQWSWFFQSLLTQYNRKGYLSPRQVESVVRVMTVAKARNESPKEFSLKAGERISVKRWIADRAKNDLNLPYFFRNLEVTEVLRETYKAYQVKVKFVSAICSSCHFCGKPIDTEISRATGIGPVCSEKHGLGRPTLETAQSVLVKLDEMCKTLGEVGPFWLPKTQVERGE